jgi:hypothetical protein
MRLAYGLRPVITQVVLLVNFTAHSKQMSGAWYWKYRFPTALLVSVAANSVINRAAGKTTATPTRTIGRFVKLVTNEQVVEVVEFETTDPALHGEMTITISLADPGGGTDVLAVHDGLPRGVPTADNEAGWRSSLAKLAALVEAG